MKTLAKITVYERTCPADDFDSENGIGIPEGVESWETDSCEITDEDLHDDGVTLDDAIQARLEEFGCGQWDGGSTGYDPDGSHMDTRGDMTERYAGVERFA